MSVVLRSRILDAAIGGYSFIPIPASYIGPGDIVSGAGGWWGLRAYSQSTTGTKAIRLRRDSDNNESDFLTLTDGSGKLDMTAIQNFKGTANLFCVKLYDQSGNGHDFAQATGAFQPPFNLNVLGSFPALVVTSSIYSLTATVAALSQAFSMSAVSMRTGDFTTVEVLWIEGTNNTQIAYMNVANQMRIFAGTSLTVTVSDSVWHSLHCVFNGTVNSDFEVDQTANTGNAGMAGTGNSWTLVNNYSDFEEFGYWASTALTSTQCNNLATNQKNFWGF
jgi:hypothetical protein